MAKRVRGRRERFMGPVDWVLVVCTFQDWVRAGKDQTNGMAVAVPDWLGPGMRIVYIGDNHK
jgi:hypothetical protein